MELFKISQVFKSDSWCPLFSLFIDFLLDFSDGHLNTVTLFLKLFYLGTLTSW